MNELPKQLAISGRMKEARIRAKLTQAAVGERVAQILQKEAPLSSQAVAGWEKGQMPSMENFIAWCYTTKADPTAILLGQIPLVEEFHDSLDFTKAIVSVGKDRHNPEARFQLVPHY